MARTSLQGQLVRLEFGGMYKHGMDLPEQARQNLILRAIEDEIVQNAALVGAQRVCIYADVSGRPAATRWPDQHHTAKWSKYESGSYEQPEQLAVCFSPQKGGWYIVLIKQHQKARQARAH